GRVDFAIHVRDTDHDGRPDYEWRQEYPPLPDDPRVSGFYRTSIMANTEDDEVPLTGYVFWPLLSRQPAGFVKDYNLSLPPIQVNWEKAKIIQVSEFVASRRNPGNFFIYSNHRVIEGQTTVTNFENPFAFYDLAGAKDGFPDMSIRFEAILPDELPNAHYPGPLDIVEYAWDQSHSHNWTYQVSMTGRHAVDETIHFPDF